MILLNSVYIRPVKSLSSDDRLNIFKFTLASYSVLPITKAIFCIKLDNAYSRESSNLETYIKTLFNDPIILFTRFTTKEEWKESGILDLINNLPDKIVWFTQNDDHPFIDSNLNVLNEGIKLLENDEKPFTSLLYSHHTEHIALCTKMNAKKVSKYYVKFECPLTDSIQIVSKKFLNFLLQEIQWPSESMIRIDFLIRDYRIWGVHGNELSNVDVNSYVPLKELCRHMDGAPSHPKVDFGFRIPPNFFEKGIIIKYCNTTYDKKYWNMHPYNNDYSVVDVHNDNNKEYLTDQNLLLSDIPLFFKNYIKEIIIDEKCDEKELINQRNINMRNNTRGIPHKNYWIKTNYIVPEDWYVNDI